MFNWLYKHTKRYNEHETLRKYTLEVVERLDELKEIIESSSNKFDEINKELLKRIHEVADLQLKVRDQTTADELFDIMIRNKSQDTIDYRMYLIKNTFRTRYLRNVHRMLEILDNYKEEDK